MQQKLSNVGLVMPAPRYAEQMDDAVERWPAPVATAFVIGSSLSLWAILFSLAIWISG